MSCNIPSEVSTWCGVSYERIEWEGVEMPSRLESGVVTGSIWGNHRPLILCTALTRQIVRHEEWLIKLTETTLGPNDAVELEQDSLTMTLI